MRLACEFWEVVTLSVLLIPYPQNLAHGGRPPTPQIYKEDQLAASPSHPFPDHFYLPPHPSFSLLLILRKTSSPTS